MKSIRPITPTDLTGFDRIILHLRCLYHDHKYRWHLAGVWREIRPWHRKPSISRAAALTLTGMTATRQVIRRGQISAHFLLRRQTLWWA